MITMMWQYFSIQYPQMQGEYQVMFCQILIESVSMGHHGEVHHLDFAPHMGGWVNVLINHPIHPWPWPWHTKAMTHTMHGQTMCRHW